MKVTKSSGGVPRLSYTGRDDRHFLPTGLYIIKTVNGLSACLSVIHIAFCERLTCVCVRVMVVLPFSSS